MVKHPSNLTRVFDPHVKFVKMKTKKSNKNEIGLTQFWYVGMAVFLIFSVTTVVVLQGKCQEEIQLRTSILNLQMAEKRESEGLFHDDFQNIIDDLESVDEPEEPEEQLVPYVIPEGGDEADFLMQLRAAPQRKGSKSVGIVNIGNSCYANSTWQVLFRIPEVKRVVNNLEIYLPRLNKEFEILKTQVEENNSILQLKSSFKAIYNKDLSFPGTVNSLKDFIDAMPEEFEALKNELRSHLQEFQILVMTRQLETNYRMINEIVSTRHQNKYQRGREVAIHLMEKSLTSLNELTEAMIRSKEGKDSEQRNFIDLRIENVAKKRELLARILTKKGSRDFLSHREFKDVYKPADLGRFVDIFREEVAKFETFYNTQIRTSNLSAEHILALHQILHEFKQLFLFESKKRENISKNEKMDSMVKGYKILEGLQGIFEKLQTHTMEPVSLDDKDMQAFGKFVTRTQEDAVEYFFQVIDAISEVVPPSQMRHIQMSQLNTKVLKLEGYEDEHRPEQHYPLVLISLLVEGLNFDISMGIYFDELRNANAKSEQHPDVTGTMIELNKLESLPKIIPFQLQRFSTTAGGLDRKISDNFLMPDEINFAPYVTPASDTPILYRLKAIIFHSGASRHSGHYYSYARNSIYGQNSWYKFNDSYVSRTRDADIEVAKTKGYMYFYERVEPLAIEN